MNQILLRAYRLSNVSRPKIADLAECAAREGSGEGATEGGKLAESVDAHRDVLHHAQGKWLCTERQTLSREMNYKHVRARQPLQGSNKRDRLFSPSVQR